MSYDLKRGPYQAIENRQNLSVERTLRREKVEERTSWKAVLLTIKSSNRMRTR